MKKVCFILLLLISQVNGYSQFPAAFEDPNAVLLEDLADANDELEEDDNILQQMEYYRDNPLSINAGEDELKNFPLLSSQLIVNLLAYRKTLGDFVSIYELKAVPGFTSDINQKLAPYITVSANKVEMDNLLSRLSNGKHSLLVRPTRVKQNPSSDQQSMPTFAGNELYLLVRYKYQYRNLLQFGFTGEKDAGEPLFPRKFPFTDFSSFHFFVRNTGRFKAIAIGDYTINLGQGLIHWQNQAFKKSSAVLQVKRQANVIKPFQSVGEHNFFRGIALTMEYRKFESSIFFSVRNLSANLDEDSLQGTVITSFVTSGLHRTDSEIGNRHTAIAYAAGTNFRRILRNGHIGLNMIGHQYSFAIRKTIQPYNFFAISGKRWINSSVDYSFTHRNYHFFGEFAGDRKNNIALLSGLISSLNAQTDIACIFRNITKAYQSVAGNAFTESSLPTNEKGFYTGMSLKLPASLKLEVYADLFSSPWLKFRVDAPSTGSQYLVQLYWKPSKLVEVYSRYRHRMKPLNDSDEEEKIDYPGHNQITNWRTHVGLRVSKTVQLRSRVEVTSFAAPGIPLTEKGYLAYTDIIYVPPLRWFSGNARVMFFETGSYNTRIYTYENDLLFVGNVPAYNGSGFRCYLNLKGNLRLKRFPQSRLTISFKLALTGSANQTTTETTVYPNRRLDVKVQAFIVPFA